MATVGGQRLCEVDSEGVVLRRILPEVNIDGKFTNRESHEVGIGCIVTARRCITASCLSTLKKCCLIGYTRTA